MGPAPLVHCGAAHFGPGSPRAAAQFQVRAAPRIRRSPGLSINSNHATLVPLSAAPPSEAHLSSCNSSAQAKRQQSARAPNANKAYLSLSLSLGGAHFWPLYLRHRETTMAVGGHTFWPTPRAGAPSGALSLARARSQSNLSAERSRRRPSRTWHKELNYNFQPR